MSIFQTLNPSTTPAHMTGKGILSVRREAGLQHILNTVTVASAIGLMLYGIQSIAGGLNLAVFIPFASSVVILVGLTLLRRIPFPIRGGLLSVLLALEFLEKLLREGSSGTAAAYALLFAVVLSALFRRRAGVVAFALALSLESLSILGFFPLPNSSLLAAPLSWISPAVAWSMAFIAIVGVAHDWGNALEQSTRSQAALQQEMVHMAQEQGHAADLRVRIEMDKMARLEAINRLAGVIADQDEQSSLLTQTVNGIQEQFGLYFAGIFLNDANRDFTYLKAATGLEGAELLRAGFRLRVGSTGLVGQVSSEGSLILANNVAANPLYLGINALPDSRGELAIPILWDDHIAGVLDLQSSVVDAFDAELVDRMIFLSQQLSQALKKLNEIQILRERQTALEKSLQTITRDTWDSHFRQAERKFTVSSSSNEPPASFLRTPEAQEALASGRVIVAAPSDADAGAVIALPIRIREQTLGVVRIRAASARVSSDTLALAEEMVNRLAEALENIRLLEELQMRAERDRMIGQIGVKVRAANDVDSILRTAANELGRSLGVAEVVVQLTPRA